MIYHGLPFLAFSPVFPDLYLFDLGSPSQFLLSPIKQMNRDGTELALPGIANGYPRLLSKLQQHSNLKWRQQSQYINTSDNEEERQTKDRSNLLSSADIPHTAVASCLP